MKELIENHDYGRYSAANYLASLSHVDAHNLVRLYDVYKLDDYRILQKFGTYTRIDRASILSSDQVAWLKSQIAEHNVGRYYGGTTCTADDMRSWLKTEFGLVFSQRTFYRILRALNIVHAKVRRCGGGAVHEENEEELKRFFDIHAEIFQTCIEVTGGEWKFDKTAKKKLRHTGEWKMSDKCIVTWNDETAIQQRHARDTSWFVSKNDKAYATVGQKRVREEWNAVKQGSGGKGGRWNLVHWMDWRGWVKNNEATVEQHKLGGKKTNTGKRVIPQDYHDDFDGANWKKYLNEVVIPALIKIYGLKLIEE